MNTFVLKLNQNQQSSLKNELKTSQINSSNTYVSFAAKKEDTTITIYTSGKVVFQGRQAKKWATTYGYSDENDDTKTKESNQNLDIIGTDEVGNGSYFGGLAVVASFVTPNQHNFLRKLGVGDSKTLTDLKIRQLAPLLKEKITHQALLLSPKKYNQVVGEQKDYNAVSVKVALHNQAIFLLLQKGIKPEKIVIDAFTSPKNYQKYEKAEKNHFANPISLEEKAEGKYLAVAVSSIIARDMFLENLENLSQATGYHLPSGAGAKSDQVASQLIRAYGMTALEETAKLHFANTQKALKLSQK